MFQSLSVSTEIKKKKKKIFLLDAETEKLSSNGEMIEFLSGSSTSKQRLCRCHQATFPIYKVYIVIIL